jgi:hypothetical protein
MSAVRRKLKNKKPPPGWELIEEVSGCALYMAHPSKH